MSGESGRWATPADIARELSCSRQSIYRMVRIGKIPSLKIPGLRIRIDREQLGVMLERSVQTQGQPAAAHGKGGR